MPSELVEGVVFGRLFTFLPPTRASQFSEQMAIDDRPEPMPSPLNYPAYFWRLPYNCLNNRQDNNKCWLMRLLTTTFGLKTRQNNASRVSRRSFKGANSLWMRKWFPAPVQNIFNICLPVLTVYRHYQIFHHVSGIQ